MSRLMMMLLLVLLSVSVQARSKYEHDPMDFDPQVFAEQHSRLVKEVRSGERYREIAPEDRERVLKSLQALAALLSGVSSIEAMHEEDKVELFNHQEVINTLLTEAAEDSRVVCRREIQTGSHRRINVCMTVAQRRLEIERSRDFYRSIKRPNEPPESPCEICKLVN